MTVGGATTHQAVIGLTDALLVIELAFVQFAAFAAIDQQLFLDLHAFDQEGDAFARNALAGAKLRANQRCRIDRIRAQHACFGEKYLHTASFDA